MQPLLDTFLNLPIALTGCHSLGIARSSCEYDVLVVTPEERPTTTIRIGSDYFDIVFVREKDVMKPNNPEFGVSLSTLIQLRDNSLVLSTGSSAARAMVSENARRSAQDRLTSSVKALSRVEEALTKGRVVDADLWLLAAGYDYSFASGFASGMVPAPSHILRQMKDLSKGGRTNFEAWSMATGLEHASRTSSRERLDGLSIIYDVMRTASVEGDSERRLSGYSSEAAFSVVESKATYLASSLQPADSYSFLGLESVVTLRALQELHSLMHHSEPDYGAIVTDLTIGAGRFISERVIKSLGLKRSERVIRRNADILRESVSDIAKRI